MIEATMMMDCYHSFFFTFTPLFNYIFLNDGENERWRLAFLFSHFI